MNNSEYLKSLGPHELADWFNAEHVEAKPVGALGRHAEHEMDSEDSREKLEADVRKHYAYSTTTLMYPPSTNKTTDMLSALPVDTVIGWLDRQAAITRATEQGRVAELKAELAKRDKGIARLKRQRDEARGKLQEACQNPAKPAHSDCMPEASVSPLGGAVLTFGGADNN